MDFGQVKEVRTGLLAFLDCAAPMSSPAPEDSSASGRDWTGSRWGDYQMLRRLGRGGMADVYVAQQLSLERQVAMKVLRPDLARDEAYVRRFEREARAAADLAHPNIIQIYEIGQWEGNHYIVQEFVDGSNLREYVRRFGAMTPDQVINVLYAVASALDRASSRGIIHRDVKPENIMLGVGGEVKVADFGLARIDRPGFQSELTQIGLTMGTPLYMSPEQIQGKAVDARSDLYSLGVTAFYLLTGHPPFEGDSPLAIAVKHMNEPPPPLDAIRGGIPQPLIQIVEALLAKEPARRIQTPAKLMQQLESVAGRTLGPASLSTAVVHPLEATERLQALLKAERSWIGLLGWFVAGPIVLALAVSAAWAGSWLARQSSSSTIEVLRSGAVEVPLAATVQEQFLHAARTQTVEAWQAVGKYFPPADSGINQAYFEKAALQLARLQIDRGALGSATKTLEQLVNSPQLLMRVLALAEWVRLESDRGDAASASRTMQRLETEYRQLNSEQRELVRRVAPRLVSNRLAP